MLRNSLEWFVVLTALAGLLTFVLGGTVDFGFGATDPRPYPRNSGPPVIPPATKTPAPGSSGPPTNTGIVPPGMKIGESCMSRQPCWTTADPLACCHERSLSGTCQCSDSDWEAIRTKSVSSSK